MTGSGMDLGPASLLDATMVSARGRSGREWCVHSYNASSDEYRLVPLGDDVRPAQRHGQFNGGVRQIRVRYEDLHNGDKWRRVGRVCGSCGHRDPRWDGKDASGWMTPPDGRILCPDCAWMQAGT